LPARVCTITDPAGRVTSMLYNASGQLTRITDPDAAQFNYAYDAGSGRMTALVDPRSNTTAVAYNFAGRVATITRPDGSTEQFKALQLQALCDAGQCTAGQPGAALLAAEAVADYTDPRGNAWDGVGIGGAYIGWPIPIPVGISINARYGVVGAAGIAPLPPAVPPVDVTGGLGAPTGIAVGDYARLAEA
jgi:YD repeat-containing protein